MSTATELLRRALEALDTVNSVSIGKSLLREQIQDFLAAEPEAECSDHPDAPHGFDRNASHNSGRYVCTCEGWEPEAEPVAFIQPNHLEKARTAPFLCLVGPEHRDDFLPLYTTPEPARKPMTEEEIAKGFYGRPWPESTAEAFTSGVRFAEKHLGINSSIPSLNDTISADSRDLRL